MIEEARVNEETGQFFYKWSPDSGEPEAVLVFQHGFLGHAGSNRHLGEWFSERGVAVYSPDMRGHGRHWSGDHIDGHIESFDLVCEDLRSLVKLASSENEGRPVFLGGHSMGGLTVCYYGIKYGPEGGVNGIIVSSPGFKSTPKLTLGQKIKNALKPLIGKIKPKMVVPFDIDPELLTHDEERRWETREDPERIKQITVHTAIIFEEQPKIVLSRAAEFQTPVLFMVSMADQVVSPEASLEFYEAIGSQDKELVKWEGFAHEMFEETPERREKVLEKTLAWMRARY